jgi:hypothetical protein
MHYIYILTSLSTSHREGTRRKLWRLKEDFEFFDRILVIDRFGARPMEKLVMVTMLVLVEAFTSINRMYEFT